MITFLTNLRLSMSITEKWLMLYEESWDSDGVMHPRVIYDIEI